MRLLFVFGFSASTTADLADRIRALEETEKALRSQLQRSESERTREGREVLTRLVMCARGSGEVWSGGWKMKPAPTLFLLCPCVVCLRPVVTSGALCPYPSPLPTLASSSASRPLSPRATLDRTGGGANCRTRCEIGRNAPGG